MGNARVTPMAQRVALIAEWERSGQTIIEFCQRRGINESTFGWWRREIARARKPASAVELVEIETKASSPARAVEVVLPNGIAVRVPVGFERRSLVEILAVVSAC
jgi:hypothetical protein